MQTQLRYTRTHATALGRLEHTASAARSRFSVLRECITIMTSLHSPGRASGHDTHATSGGRERFLQRPTSVGAQARNNQTNTAVPPVVFEGTATAAASVGVVANATEQQAHEVQQKQIRNATRKATATSDTVRNKPTFLPHTTFVVKLFTMICAEGGKKQDEIEGNWSILYRDGEIEHNVR